jgi:hypothetical protein
VELKEQVAHTGGYMLGKGRYVIVREWKNDPYGDGIQVIEYCETIEEGEEFIRQQKKDDAYDWEIMLYV